MTELTCENCFWFEGNGGFFGRCRNPRNASVGHAGSDYSSSDLLKPMETKINMVCDLHEAPTKSNVRQVFEVTLIPSGSPYGPMSWVRKP